MMKQDRDDVSNAKVAMGDTGNERLGANIMARATVRVSRVSGVDVDKVDAEGKERVDKGGFP